MLGPLEPGRRQAEPARQRQRLAASGRADDQPVGGQAVLRIETHRGAGGRLRLEGGRGELGEVGRQDAERTALDQAFEQGDSERGALLRVRPGANLVEQNQGRRPGAAPHLAEAEQPGAERRLLVEDALLVAHHRHDVVEDRQATVQPGGNRQTGLVHQAEQPHRLQGDRLAAGVRTGQHQGSVIVQLQVERHDDAPVAGRAQRQLPAVGQPRIEQRVAGAAEFQQRRPAGRTVGCDPGKHGVDVDCEARRRLHRVDGGQKVDARDDRRREDLHLSHQLGQDAAALDLPVGGDPLKFVVAFDYLRGFEVEAPARGGAAPDESGETAAATRGKEDRHPAAPHGRRIVRQSVAVLPHIGLKRGLDRSLGAPGVPDERPQPRRRVVPHLAAPVQHAAQTARQSGAASAVLARRDGFRGVGLHPSQRLDLGGALRRGVGTLQPSQHLLAGLDRRGQVEQFRTAQPSTVPLEMRAEVEKPIERRHQDTVPFDLPGDLRVANPAPLDLVAVGFRRDGAYRPAPDVGRSETREDGEQRRKLERLGGSGATATHL